MSTPLDLGAHPNQLRAQGLGRCLYFTQVAVDANPPIGVLEVRHRADFFYFPAHTGLWDMAERTKHDLLARLALVPRTLEARGLDASPAVRAKLVGAGDRRAGEILDIILRDEIGHVAVGNRWYRHACARLGLDPVAIYPGLAERYEAPRPRAPFNLAARRAAGFEEAELLELAKSQERVTTDSAAARR